MEATIRSEWGLTWNDGGCAALLIVFIFIGYANSRRQQFTPKEIGVTWRSWMMIDVAQRWALHIDFFIIIIDIRQTMLSVERMTTTIPCCQYWNHCQGETWYECAHNKVHRGCADCVGGWGTLIKKTHTHTLYLCISLPKVSIDGNDGMRGSKERIPPCISFVEQVSPKVLCFTVSALDMDKLKLRNITTQRDNW